jgi:phosphotriesterase-related protein
MNEAERRHHAQQDDRPGRRRALQLLAGGALAWRGALITAAGAQGQTAPGPLRVPRGAVLRTVLGDIDPNGVNGATLMHEHLGTGRPGRGGGPATDPTQDAAWMLEELQASRKAGLGCIVSGFTNLPTAPEIEYLRSLARGSGLHVIAAAAPYFTQTYPEILRTGDEPAIVDWLVTGARDSRLGAFGELGVNNNTADLDPLEKKVFRAMGRAQARTGLPVFTHTNYSTGPNVPMDMGLRQLDLLLAGGASAQSVAIGHVCCLDDPMVTLHKQLAKRGCFIAFDRVTRQQQWVADTKRVAMLKALLDAGLADQLLLSSDYIGRINTSVGEVNMYPGPLHGREGGPGYARPLVLFVPLMRKNGISDALIHQLTVDNPRRFLSFVPKAA